MTNQSFGLSLLSIILAVDVLIAFANLRKYFTIPILLIVFIANVD